LVLCTDSCIPVAQLEQFTSRRAEAAHVHLDLLSRLQGPGWYKQWLVASSIWRQPGHACRALKGPSSHPFQNLSLSLSLSLTVFVASKKEQIDPDRSDDWSKSPRHLFWLGNSLLPKQVGEGYDKRNNNR
jgi:hypothetical protein